jgi:hypothetical protein
MTNTNNQGLTIAKNDNVQITIGDDIYNGTVKWATWEAEAGWNVSMTINDSPGINTLYIGMRTEWVEASQGGQITKI